MALQNGHHQTVAAYLKAILDSDLEPKAKKELLAPKRDDVPGLFMALQDGHYHAVTAYMKAALDPRLDLVSQEECLLTSPLLFQYMIQNGHAACLQNYLMLILESQLSAQFKSKILNSYIAAGGEPGIQLSGVQMQQLIDVGHTNFKGVDLRETDLSNLRGFLQNSSHRNSISMAGVILDRSQVVLLDQPHYCSRGLVTTIDLAGHIINPDEPFPPVAVSPPTHDLQFCIDAVTSFITAYIEQPQTSTYKFWHNHSLDGQYRAGDLQSDLAACRSYTDLKNLMHTTLAGDAGNTNPHSLKTHLLAAMSFLSKANYSTPIPVPDTIEKTDLALYIQDHSKKIRQEEARSFQTAEVFMPKSAEHLGPSPVAIEPV